MEQSCCGQLQACAPGSPCGSLFDCYNACKGDNTCMQSSCPDLITSGGPAVQALDACNQASCSSCQ